MAPVASNDAELAAMLAGPVMQGMQIVGEMFIEPEIGIVVGIKTGRGSGKYQGGGGFGSLSQSWTTKTSVGAGFNLGVMETYYDSSKLSHIPSMGIHTTPDLDDRENGNFRHVYNGGDINDMASLIDLGLGGMLFGPVNPTREATHFWDLALAKYRASERRWVTAGLRSAGLPVM